MAVVAGIDEAGYGPRLGPLVVSGVAFEVPDEAEGQCLWERLAGIVGRSPRDRALIAVDDSKRLFSQAGGVRHIERAALAFAAAAHSPEASAAESPSAGWHRRPACDLTFRSLLASLAEMTEDLDAYPWYRGADFSLPLAADPAQLEADAARLRSADGARFLEARSCPVLVGEFNRTVERVGTKSATLFMKTALLLARFWRQWGERGLTVHVDKHGGRDRYGLLLYDTFFGARIRTLTEGRNESLYEIRDDRRRMTVGFYVNGDSRHLPIALASIYSKYLRELFMRNFNAWWAERLPGLKPTAGYAADANRFLADTAALRPALGIDESLLIRSL